MPSETLAFCERAGVQEPCLHALNWLAAVGEDVGLMSASTRFQDLRRTHAERYGYRLSALHLLALDPHELPLDVDVVPGEAEHVVPAQTGQQ